LFRLNTIEIPITIDLPLSSVAAPDGPVAASAQAHSSTQADWDDAVDAAITRAAVAAAALRGFDRGRIGVMVTDDETIHQINHRHLDHDYPTDVISFTYDRSGRSVEGEMVVSLCTARRSAQELGWDWRSELLLYVVHGTLHICGLEDSTPDQQHEMRLAERAVLARLGIDDISRDHDQNLVSEDRS